jgi:hypothetical protein
MPSKFEPITDSKPGVAKILHTGLNRLVSGEDIRPKPSPELAARINPGERGAVMSDEPLQSLQKGLAATWPGGSLTLVNRAPLSGEPHGEVSVYRLAKGKEALLIVFLPGPRDSMSAFGVMADRPYE